MAKVKDLLYKSVSGKNYLAVIAALFMALAFFLPCYHLKIKAFDYSHSENYDTFNKVVVGITIVLILAAVWYEKQILLVIVGLSAFRFIIKAFTIWSDAHKELDKIAAEYNLGDLGVSVTPGLGYIGLLIGSILLVTAVIADITFNGRY